MAVAAPMAPAIPNSLSGLADATSRLRKPKRVVAMDQKEASTVDATA